MSTATDTVHLDAGGLLLTKARVDANAAEQIVARSYRHPALGDRPVIRLASDRLGQAEDLAMEFLGFAAPAVSVPVALQQRRSLGFAAWALINDATNARYALDLVKRMKAAARKAKSKPGNAWDAYSEMAKELGRSVRHFLPPFWEEVGRTFKDLGNPTYAGRALNKSLEAERVHALESDRARRRDVVLEFVLSGCLSGNALSDYGNDLQNHHAPKEAFAIFRDLCVRRTRGGMSPWATLPKDFAKLAKAAGLDADQELERCLEEVIDAPAMARPPHQFWKTCSRHCERIVARNPAFAVALLRHTRPEARYYGESKLPPWFELLEEWGVLDYLWEDEHRGAPPLGEPIAAWLSRIVLDEVPAPKRTLEMLERLAPRLRKEKTPLPVAGIRSYGGNTIDIDVLEACFVLGIKVDDPPPGFSVTFVGWLAANVDHPLRNQDIVESCKDERFKSAIFHGLGAALTSRGGDARARYRQANVEQRPFPRAAGDRPGIKELWRLHTSGIIAGLEVTGLASFEWARDQLGSTLWPETLRLFPDIAERLSRVDPCAMLRRTLQAGIFDEYGLPALEEAVDRANIKIHFDNYRRPNTYLTFPSIVVSDKVHAHVISSDGTIKTHELRLPTKSEVNAIVVVGDDLAVSYRDEKYQGHFHWASNPAQEFESDWYGLHRGAPQYAATLLRDGSVFLGQQIVRPGDKKMPASQSYLHDGERFWRLTSEYDLTSARWLWKIGEVDPQTGKQVRASVPSWFEETDEGTIEWITAELMPGPSGSENSPLGTKDGMLGWKTVKRRDGSYYGQGVDGRRWDAPLIGENGTAEPPVGLLRQPGTAVYLPVTTSGGGRAGMYKLWDPTGSTVVAQLQDFSKHYARGQVVLLPLQFWHLLKVRDVAASETLRTISQDQCAALFKAAAADREQQSVTVRIGATEAPERPVPNLLAAVKTLLPTAPERLALGVARMIEHAEQASAAFTALRDKTSADGSKETETSALVADRKSDAAAAHWAMPQLHHSIGGEGGFSVSDHLSAAAKFLKGERNAGELPPTGYLWFAMLESLPSRCWQTFWRVMAVRLAEKGTRELPWLEFLKHWQELGIAALPGRFDIMEGYPEDAKKNNRVFTHTDMIGCKSFTFRNSEDMFVFIKALSYGQDQPPYHVLRYSTSETPGTPPGYQVKNVRTFNTKVDPLQITAFIAAVESRAEPPLPTSDELVELAAKVSASPEEIGLIWLGGLNLDSHESNFLPAELRKALGWKTTDASAARQSLRNLKPVVLAHLYEAVVAEGCAAPFAPDRGPVLRSIENAWQTKMPKRLQLDATLQKRLSVIGSTSRWQKCDHEQLLAAAVDPANHALLQRRELEIKVDTGGGYRSLNLGVKNKNEEVQSGASLRSLVQLVGLVHAETAVGHPARSLMPALIKQSTELLEHSSTLLQLRHVYVYDAVNKKALTPTEWINKHVGNTHADANDGTARFDDGLIVAAALDSQSQALFAYRPAKLRDEGDVARLSGILGTDIGGGYPVGDGFLPIVATIKGPGFQKLAKAIVTKEVPEGQWPQNPKHTAPAVVSAIQKKHKLGEDAAVLYAQLLAVPDPTTANVCAWNGWSAAQLKALSAELVGRRLVLEAKRDRAGRSFFLPGEWLDLKAPWLPIESWKLAHLVDLDMNVRNNCPAGGPMVLRPFEDLFAAAWQRILDGDEPRYEDVQPKKQKTTK
jgi:hypothetical protein